MDSEKEVHKIFQYVHKEESHRKPPLGIRQPRSEESAMEGLGLRV